MAKVITVWVVLRKWTNRDGHEIVTDFDNPEAAHRKVYHLTVEQGGGGTYYEVQSVRLPA